MSVVLWHIEVSHYNEKARWALDYKRIPHERRVPMPGLHGLRALLLTRGGQRRLPVLELDGTRIGDSTAIIAALEEHTPEPPLYPADPGERARALELEDWFDERLAPALRRLVWYHTLPDADAVAAAIFTRPSPVRERLLRMMAPVARPVVRRDYDVSAETAEQARAQVVAAMYHLESELQPSGYLVGDGFTVADLTAAALFTPLLAPPQRPYAPPTLARPLLELREELSARPGGEWVAEMYARHRGRSAEVLA
ncbi:MAG: glutathione S-transferase family protein [Solirubrobacterales bacterium]